MNGARAVPVSFLPVYAQLGQISVDRLLTGQDWSPEEQPVTYGDVLQLLSTLSKKKAAELLPAGAGVSFKDPALVCMLGALSGLEQIQKGGFPGVAAEATLRGLLTYEELQAPLYDFSDASAATLHRLTAAAVQENEESSLDKMLRLIRCTALRAVSK